MHRSAVDPESVQQTMAESSRVSAICRAAPAMASPAVASASPEAAHRDPEVVAIARRRNFSGSERRRLLAEFDRCKEAGALGASLRREGIYSSMISTSD
jgi:transposase